MSVQQPSLQRIRAALTGLQVPSAQDAVVNDECVYSFDNPFSEQGLFVNLRTWQGVGADFLALDFQKHHCHLYLQEIFRYIPKPQVEEAPQAAPTKLAIGVEGGFLPGDLKFETAKEYYVCYVDESGVVDRISFPNQELPELLTMCCQAIIDHEGFHKQAQVAAWEDTTERPVSKYAESLIQLDNGKKISNDPSTWVCEESGMRENLWLNLSTGHIGSGRRNWDGTGGTGAALHHYEATGGLYPLVVKLGTITAHGADVWSYAPDEDCLVTDPKLAEHLSHWGIDIMKLEKTDKSLAEMEVDLNNSYEFGKITEAGKKLEPRSGPGFVGLRNTGNSCYFNSVLEVLYGLPELQQRYYEAADRIFQTAPTDVTTDFPAQMAKVGVALRTDRYVKPNVEGDDAEAETLRARYAVIPRMLRHLVGKGHPEFSSNRQQDALEYYQHFLEYMNRIERTQLERLGGSKPVHTSSLFSFELEDRIQCTESQTVKYVSHPENVLSLSIPLQSIPESAESEAKRAKRDITELLTPRAPPTVPFQECVNTFASPEIVEILSPAVGHRTNATKQTRFKTFPRYLMVQLRRYYVNENWQPTKIEALVDVPEHLNLEHLRSTGLQPGEAPMPEAGSEQQQQQQGSAQPQPDPNVVAQIVAMGFSENAGARAALAANNDPEGAANWLFSHLDDPDLNDPLPATTGGNGGGAGDASDVTVDPDTLMMLTSMGFTEAQVKGALKATSGNAERAADWLFSHADDLDAALAALDVGSAPSGVGAGAGSHQLEDGEGRYTLIGFITHMGRNTGHGHYVCHIKKGDEWVMFNDDVVCRSEEVPIPYGYMFLYRRDDAPTDI